MVSVFISLWEFDVDFMLDKMHFNFLTNIVIKKTGMAQVISNISRCSHDVFLLHLQVWLEVLCNIVWEGSKLTAFTLLDDDSKKYFQRDLQLICLILFKIQISAP